MNADRAGMPLDKIESTALIEQKAEKLLAFCKENGIALWACECHDGVSVQHADEKDGEAEVVKFEDRFE